MCRMSATRRVSEYRAALTVRDGQPDTRMAAEKGIKQPYEVPHHEHIEPAGDDEAAPAPQPQGAAQPPASNPQKTNE